MEEKKQRILIVHNYYQIPGGEDTVVENEKKLLEIHGHDVTLYTRNNLELNTISIWKKALLPFIMIYNPRTAIDIKKIIKEKHIDIIHVHNTLNLISLAVYYVAIANKVPVLQTIHNFRMLCPGGTFYRDGHICEDCVKYGFGCAIKHKCYRGSKLQTFICVVNSKLHRMTGIYGKINYICFTDFNKKKLLQLDKINSEQIFIKPNFTYNPEKVEEKGECYLFIGRLEEIKGINLLLSAFEILSNIEIHIVGSGKERYEEIYKKCRNIVFLGQLSRKDIGKEYRKAKALIVTSQIYETFGMTIIEAFSYGVPVIVGNIGNVGALVEENITGFHYQYNNCKALVKTILKFEKNDTSMMRKNAFAKFNEYYTAECNYNMLMDIYKKIEMLS